MSRGLRQYTFMLVILFIGMSIGSYFSLETIKIIGLLTLIMWVFNFADENWNSGRHAK